MKNSQTNSNYAYVTALFRLRPKTPNIPPTSSPPATEPNYDHLFRHASLAIAVGGKYIYVDPVERQCRLRRIAEPDVVLITHSHYDHLDVAAVEKLLTPDTEILCDRTSARSFRDELLRCVRAASPHRATM